MEQRELTDCTQPVWLVLFVISLTANLIVFVYILLNVAVTKIAVKRTISQDNKRPPLASVKYVSYLVSVVTDFFAGLIIFGAGFYLLVNGAVMQPFVMADSDSCHLTSAVTFVSAAAIGRLSVSVVMRLGRISNFRSSGMAGTSSRHALEDAVSMITMAVLLSTNEAPLTRALICIMPMDNHLCHLSRIFRRRPPAPPDGLMVKLKVVRCFVSMSFRGAVPFVCITWATCVFRKPILTMAVPSVIAFIGSSVFHLFYNTWIITISAREVWILCSRRNTSADDRPSTTANNNNINKLFAKRKTTPLQFRRNPIRTPPNDVIHAKRVKNGNVRRAWKVTAGGLGSRSALVIEHSPPQRSVASHLSNRPEYRPTETLHDRKFRRAERRHRSANSSSIRKFVTNEEERTLAIS